MTARLPELPPIAAFAFEGGPARELSWDQIASFKGSSGFLWVHLHRTESSHVDWLQQQAGLDELSCEILLEEETRPRFVVGSDHVIVIMRGVNLDPEEDPDDMVSLRLWIGRDRIISLRKRRLMAIQDVRKVLHSGAVLRSPVELFVNITECLLDRQIPVVDSLEDIIDTIEEELLDGLSLDRRRHIGACRRQAIGLRRYLAPQRDVLARLASDRVPWFDDICRAQMREVAERQARLVEELDAVRDRAALASEELAGRMSERLNRNMYVLSLVAAVFLPLSFVTGLLGINVGGIPGATEQQAFWIVCGGLTVIAAVVLWLFRRLRMM
ncbi:MAG: zinc transporter ZntB [Planctomycetes bacterium]|nr:zinc transporter ZntB [Planctomycetota bacterium]MCB9886682.1 zinc transporter ZntB [Planctomycetota bacterium]